MKSKIFSEFFGIVKKHDTEILAAVGITGMITGTVLAVKATPKALLLIEKKAKETEEITLLDKVKASWKCYIPAIIVEGLAIFCLVQSTVTNNKRKAALALAYSVSEAALKEYQDKVTEIVGDKKESQIRDAIAKDQIERHPIKQDEIIFTGKGDTLHYDPLSDKYFKHDIETVRQILNDANEYIINNDTISYNDVLYSLIGRELKIADGKGWNINQGKIEYKFSSQLTDTGEPCRVIVWKNPPYYYYESRY